MSQSFEPSHSYDGHGRGHTRIGRALLVLGLIVGVLVGYGLPFFGFPLSMTVPILMYVCRRQLWDTGSQPHGLGGALLTWVGLWLPGVTHFFTGWYAALTSSDQSTAWLLIPLCGPQGILAVVIPAIGAAVVFAAGLLLAVARRHPWPVVVGAWLAPWTHQLVTVILPAAQTEVIC